MHILLAEDNKLNQKIFLLMAKKKSWKVDLANNGFEALELASKNSYDCIVMDIEMPMLNGYETTSAIRQKNIKTPIIGFTANISLGRDEKCLSVGMDDSLTKPCKPEVIYDAVERLTAA